MAELIWDGKYDAHGNKRAPVRIELPFQTVETVNESAQERQRTLELSSSGHDPQWRNRLIWGDQKYVLPSLQCDNNFERACARFLDNADDVSAFAKLPQSFGFSIDYVDAGMNLRSYYPDFVAVDASGQRWLLETKGTESAEVSQKDAAAANWCENASNLTEIAWRYVKVPQKGFEVLQPRRLADLAALHPARLFSA